MKCNSFASFFELVSAALTPGLVILLAPSTTLAGGTITNLGTAGGKPISVQYLSKDGSTAVGGVLSADNTYTIRPVRWTKATGAIELGTLGGTYATVNAISADGSVIVGESRVAGDVVTRAFRWSAASGLQDLGTLGGVFSSAASISADGSIIVGGSQIIGSTRSHAFRWTATTGLVDLGTIGSVNSSADGISGDGAAITGSLYPDFCARCPAHSQVFLWTEDGGMQNIGSLGATNTNPTVISEDGNAIAGMDLAPPPSNGTNFFLWTPGTGMLNIGSFGQSYINGMSRDGSVLVGTIQFGNAFRWTAKDGFMFIGNLGEFGDSYSLSTDAEASTVAGYSLISHSSGLKHATLWSTSLSYVDLNVYLSTQGIDLSGWVLNDATAISADGRTIAGNGTFNGQPSAYLVTLCRADFNNDGFVTGDDYDAFVDAFVLGASAADFNRDGFVTGDDFDFFADAFAAGC